MKRNLAKKLILTLAIPFLLNSNLYSPESKLLSESEVYEILITKKFDILKNIEYMSDLETYGIPGYTYLQNPQETLKRGKGNCSDKSILLKSSLDSLGLKTQLVYGWKDKKASIVKEDLTKHCWLQYHVGGKDYVIEAAGKGKILRKDTLESGRYLPIIKQPYVTKHLDIYEKRNGVRLDFKYYL